MNKKAYKKIPQPWPVGTLLVNDLYGFREGMGNIFGSDIFFFYTERMKEWSVDPFDNTFFHLEKLPLKESKRGLKSPLPISGTFLGLSYAYLGRIESKDYGTGYLYDEGFRYKHGIIFNILLDGRQHQHMRWLCLYFPSIVKDTHKQFQYPRVICSSIKQRMMKYGWRALIKCE